LILYRPTDRIPVRIGPVTFWVSPLSYLEKAELISLVQRKEGEENTPAFRYAIETLRRSLKKVEGLKCADGSDYALEMGDDGYPTFESVEDLANVEGSEKLITIVGNFAMKEIKDYGLEGVVIDFSKVESVKKTIGPSAGPLVSFLAERVHEISCVTTIEYATIWATLSALDNAGVQLRAVPIEVRAPKGRSRDDGEGQRDQRLSRDQSDCSTQAL
jgi:hypothetical protein